MNTQFENWWTNEVSHISDLKELCRTAWENGAYCALNPVVPERPYTNCMGEHGPTFSQELHNAQAKAVEALDVMLDTLTSPQPQ